MAFDPTNIRVTAQSPYPPIEVSAENSLYAKLLSHPIASKDSEMTAITTYLYQHWYLHKHCREISDLFRRIAQVEMHHLEMLGLLVGKLGGNPQLRRCMHPQKCTPSMCSCAYWNASMTNYETDVKQILCNNIKDEQGAIKEYRELISQISDPLICAVLKRIIMDEEVHISIFKSLLSQCR